MDDGGDDELGVQQCDDELGVQQCDDKLGASTELAEPGVHLSEALTEESSG
jgi:hypothetical protein